MLQTLREIFETGTIELNERGERTRVNSHTPWDQGIFLQKIFDLVKPKKTLEVGLAYGISALFILEKHREHNSAPGSHIIIEPIPWDDTAAYNMKKEGLFEYADIRNDFSDLVIPSLYVQKERIQYAYVDTTKLYDVVMQDFYFIDKILDVGGVIIIDDCDSPGISKVARFINSLPHYKILDKIGRSKRTNTYLFFEKIFSLMIAMLPFKSKFIPNFSFRTARQLGLDYRCIAFQKTRSDNRNWDWDSPL